MTLERLSVAQLGDVPETLLIPLAARAIARTAFPGTGFSDPAAEVIAARLDTDLTRFSVDRGSMCASIRRAQWFDKVARLFLSEHPRGLCVSLGAGLDTRAARVGPAQLAETNWIDLDLPEVAALRTALIPDQPNVVSGTGDATDPAAWIEALPWQEGRPLLLLIEGVVMYLTIEVVHGLVTAVCSAAERRKAPMWLVLDYASPFMMRMSRRHPSVKKTRATFASSLRRPEDLRICDHRLVTADHKDVSSAAGFAGALIGLCHRLLTGGRSVHGCVHYRFEPRLV